MKPKQKAEELIDKFQNVIIDTYLSQFKNAKECALLAVEELIKETGKKYWYDVKLEIKKYDTK